MELSHKRNRSVLLLLMIIIFNFQMKFVESLKCRTDNDPTDEELKKITRVCLKKIMENNYYDADDDDNDNSNNNNNQNNNNNKNNNNENYGNFGRNNNNNNNYEAFRIRNRDYLQGKTGSNNNSNRSKRSSSSKINNNFDWNRQQQQQQQHYNNNNNENDWNNHNSNDRRYNFAVSTNNQNRNHNNSSLSTRMLEEREGHQNCLVHCFFNELNTLNDEGFPDKHKILHVLTRDIRDRQLREFYTDTIRDCYRHLDQEYWKDKCQFSKALVKCMAEYARANCDDWYDHTFIFN